MNMPRRNQKANVPTSLSLASIQTHLLAAILNLLRMSLLLLYLLCLPLPLAYPLGCALVFAAQKKLYLGAKPMAGVAVVATTVIASSNGGSGVQQQEPTSPAVKMRDKEALPPPEHRFAIGKDVSVKHLVRI